MSVRTRNRAPILSLLVGLIIVGTSACAVPADPDEGRGDLIPDDASVPTMQTVTVRDPIDDAFTVEVPEGWDSVAYSSGEFTNPRNTVTSVSPDGKTVLFMGDPKLPAYWNPDGVNPLIAQIADQVDAHEVSAYQPAESYFPEYVVRKFGELPGFEIVSAESQPGTVQGVQQGAIDAGGVAPEAHAVEVRFVYTASDELIHALVHGLTVNYGPFWTVDLTGLATNQEVDDYRPMLVAMSRSLQVNPEFTARAQANHEASMAQIQAFGEEMTRQHNANMAWIQQSAASHQSRMEAIWAQGDASMQSYYDRMDSMDHTQRDFLNYINEEETVSGATTGTTQVATGASHYYVNKYDGTYVGGDINFGDTQLRELGLDPNDYEQVTIIK